MKYFFTIFFNLTLSLVIFGQHFLEMPAEQFLIQMQWEEDIYADLQMIFHDADQDQDQDLFFVGLVPVELTENVINNLSYRIDFQRNTGDVAHSVFDSRHEMFPDFQFPRGLFYPSAGDLNGDGQTDFVTAGALDPSFDYQELIFYLQASDGIQVRFDTFHSPAFNLPKFQALSFLIPHLVDLDQDGDLDLLVAGMEPDYINDPEGAYQNVIYYAKNTGTPSTPEYLGWFHNPYGLEPVVEAELPVFLSGDLDLDGDIDVLVVPLSGEQIAIRFYENLQEPGGKPLFNGYEFSPFGLPVLQEDESFLSPALMDAEGDGDLDFFIVRNEDPVYRLEFYENTMCAQSLGFIQEEICAGETYLFGNETITESGQYFSVVRKDDGCDSIVELQIDFIEVDTAVTWDGEKLTARLSDATYQWFDCATMVDIDGAQFQSFIPESSGAYAVRITDEHGCTGVSACFSVALTGTKKVSMDKAICIYPNPASSEICIRNTYALPIQKIDFLSPHGLSFNFHGALSAGPISLQQIPSGIYLVRVQWVDERNALVKVIVNK